MEWSKCGDTTIQIKASFTKQSILSIMMHINTFCSLTVFVFAWKKYVAPGFLLDVPVPSLTSR